MLQNTLSHLSFCAQQPSSASLNTSEILKTCYYQIAKDIPKHQSSPRKINISSSSKCLQISRTESLPTLLFQPKGQQHQICALSSKKKMDHSQSFLKTMKDQSIWHQERSSLLRQKKLLQSIKTQEKFQPRVQKENKIRKRIEHRKVYVGLNKQQRYFQTSDVNVNPNIVNEIGLYKAGQLFKTKNICEKMEELKIVAHKHEFNPLRIDNAFDLFVTNVIPDSQFNLDNFMDKELSRHHHIQNTSPIPEADSAISTIRYSQIQYPASDICQGQIEPGALFVTIHNYKLVEDQQYKLFKVRNLTIWGTIQLNLNNLIKCLKEHKIQHLKFKAEHLTTWQGKRMSKTAICERLGLPTLTTAQEKIDKQVLAFRDRLKMAVRKRRILKRECLARWVFQRMKAINRMKRNRKEKIQQAERMQQQLRQFPDWEVQIYIPSFSVDSFRRNTTQYMEWFQNQYHCLWENTTRPLILILPSLNQNLLGLLQNKLKLIRPATIITPQVYTVFPQNLSLTAQVYFSFETLEKISRAVGGRKAVIIGGPYSQGIYESLLSQYLQAPLLRSVKAYKDFEEEKHFFTKAQISVPIHSFIPANISFEELLEIIADLLQKQQGEKTWVIKISGQFRGRGIATLRINPGKYLKGAFKQNKGKRQALMQTLRSSLRLKLKVNFENSVYVVEQFLNTLRKQGGIIEQHLQILSTYELCFFKLRNCQINSVFRVYGTNYNNKLWLLCPPDSSLANLAFGLGLSIQQEDRYFGHLSVTVCKTKYGYVGLDIKFGQTPAAGVAILAQRMKPPPSIGQAETVSVSQISTKRVNFEVEGHWPSPINFNELICLFMPGIPFTDVEQMNKAKLIEELMHQCWTNRHLKLGNPAKLYLSLGLDFGGILFGRDIKRLKREAGELIRDLAEKSQGLKQYRGKQMVRDVFQFGEVIRAISQIRVEDVSIS